MASTIALSPLRILATALVAWFLATSGAFAAQPETYTGRFGSDAVQGYDVVAYFTDGAPKKGSKEYSTEWKGARWLFSSQENLDTFLADPDAYAPQYGGYCAWAVAQGYTAKGDARHWAIEDGKLYLNYNADVKAKWDVDRAGFIEKADQNWPAVLD